MTELDKEIEDVEQYLNFLKSKRDSRNSTNIKYRRFCNYHDDEQGYRLVIPLGRTKVVYEFRKYITAYV